MNISALKYRAREWISENPQSWRSPKLSGWLPHIRRHLDARPNLKNEYSVGIYRIVLLGWLRWVWGLLLAIPILGILTVVSLHIEELHLVAELLIKRVDGHSSLLCQK